jgi:hypothetical protein
MSFLFGVIAASYDTTTPPPPPPPPPPPTCTPTCGAWSYTYGEWSAYSECVNNTQSRTRTVNGTRTCQASDCSIYTETSTSTETESQACTSPPPTTTWYCTYNSIFAGIGNYTSTSDQSGTTECVQATSCSTSGYPSAPAIPC